MRNPRNLTLGTKVLLLGIGGVLLTVIALTAAAIWQGNQFNSLAQEQVKQLVDADLDHIVKGVYNLTKAQDEAVQQQVNISLNVARLVFNTTGNVGLGTDTIHWDAVNQYTQEATAVNLPKMLVGETWLGQNTYPSVTTLVVDQIQYLVGGTATIFQRMNDRGDMLSVATNVKNATGQRAIGTYIPAVQQDGTPDPVIEAVLHGITYRDSAYVVDAWYDAAYEPLRSDSGQLIGMIYVGVKQENVASLRQAIRQTRVGQTGYAFVLGSDGADLGKYIVAGQEIDDGKNVWDTQDPQGNYVIQDIIKTAQTLPPGETADKSYLWQNQSDPAPRTKVARVTYYEPWHWVIVASAYEDDFGAYRQALQAGQANLVNVAALTGLIAALIVGLISWALARSISRPIGALAAAATQISTGNLNVSTDVKRQDEIGALARAFNAMTAQLRDLIGNLEQRVDARTMELAQRSEEVAQRSAQLETLNAQLQTSNRAAERRATQLATSAQVARAISQVRDLDQLLSQVTRVIGSAFDFYHIGIFIVDEANRYAVLHAASSEGGQRMLARNHKLAVGHQGMVGYVTQTGLPRIALNAGADAVHFNNPDLPDTRSEMTLPLQVSGRILGALDLQTTQAAAFSDEDLAVLGTLADQVAVAIDNARLFTRTLTTLQETEEVNKRHLRDQWQHLIPTLSATSHEYHLSGVPAVGNAPLPEIDQVLRRGEVVIATGDGSGLTARSALAVPIKLRDQIIGVIDLHETDTDRRWTDDDVAVVLAVADQVALSLENARLLDETERGAQRERTINEINSRVRQTVDLDLILQTAVNELGQSLGAARVTARIGRANAPASPPKPNGNGQGHDHE
jgi:GAF domain-containing protein/HAMP domain-containing protein